MRGGAGAAFTITPPYALPPTVSWSPRGRLFPPRARPLPSGSKRLGYPQVTSRGALPTRTERHNPHSIATMRARLLVALVSRLPHCPCCRQPRPRERERETKIDF